MDVQSQLLFIGSSAKALKLWWQNERGLTDWSNEASTPKGVPLPSYRYGKGTSYTQSYNLRKNNSDAKFHHCLQNCWQCGQQAKNSAQPFCSQAHKMTFVLI